LISETQKKREMGEKEGRTKEKKKKRNKHNKVSRIISLAWKANE